MPNYFDILPENYKLVKTIDAKNTKVVLLMNLVGILIFILSLVPFLLLREYTLDFEIKSMGIFLIVYLVLTVVYVIAHELVHGLVYKIMTKQKLTFGITLTCAFCGVPNIYVTRKTALFAILAPFVLFSLIFIPLLIIIPANMINLAILLVFGTHTSGCVGDLYGTLVLISLKGKLLMNDTGPKQTFYIEN